MSNILDWSPSPPLQARNASRLGLISDFASLARRCNRPEALLGEAAQALAAALSLTHVLIVDSAGSPPRPVHIESLGWGGVSGRDLARAPLDALLGLSPFEEWGGDETSVDTVRCTISELRGCALADLSDSLSLGSPRRPLVAALKVRCPVRGRRLSALLGTTGDSPGFGSEGYHTVSALFAVLGTALELVYRRKDYARRLRQVRRAKMAWEGAVDALPEVFCVLDREGRVTRANRAIEAWGLGSVRSAPFGTLHDLLHPGCSAEQCALGAGLAALVQGCVGSEDRERVFVDPLLGRELRVKIGCVARMPTDAERKPCGRRFALVEDITREGSGGRGVALLEGESMYRTATDWLVPGASGRDCPIEKGSAWVARDAERAGSDVALQDGSQEASRGELQRLSRALIDSQEGERKRIAGELHDGIGQTLSAVKLLLQGIAADPAGRLDARLAGQLGLCVEMTQEMIEDVRRLSMALRPAILDSVGVLVALKRLCRELNDARCGLAVHLTLEVDEGDVEEDLKIHLFRIAQEAMNNAVKHARASNLWIRLDRSGDTLRLLVRDDGSGFDLREDKARARGLGLSSMEQRARLNGGELTIDTERGRGTTVCAMWGVPAAGARGRDER